MSIKAIEIAEKFQRPDAIECIAISGDCVTVRFKESASVQPSELLAGGLASYWFGDAAIQRYSDGSIRSAKIRDTALIAEGGTVIVHKKPNIVFR